MAAPFHSRRPHHGVLRYTPAWLIRMLFAIVLCCAACAVAIAGPDEGEDDEDVPPALPSGLIAEYTAAGRSITRIDPALHFTCRDASPDPRLSPGNFQRAGRANFRSSRRGRIHFMYMPTAAPCDYQSMDDPCSIARQMCRDGSIASRSNWITAITRSRSSFVARRPVAEIGLYWSGPRFRLEPVPRARLCTNREVRQRISSSRGDSWCIGCAARRAMNFPTRATRPRGTVARETQRQCRADMANELDRGAKIHARRPPTNDKPANNPPQPAERTANKSSPPPPDPDFTIIEAHVATDIPVVALDDVKFRMPGLGLSREDARHIVAYLLDERSAMPATEKRPPVEEKLEANAAAGDTLFASLGCMGCHTIAGLGTARVSGGGDVIQCG